MDEFWKRMSSIHTFSIEVNSQVLKDVHVGGVGDGGSGCGAALVLDVGDGLCAYIQDEGVHQGYVVSIALIRSRL